MTYLQALREYNKRWFYAALFLAMGSVGANLVGVEATPFYVWGMFSQPEQPQPNQGVWQLEADGQVLDYTSWQVSLFQRYLLTNPADYAVRMTEAGTDPTLNFLESKLGAQEWLHLAANQPQDLEKFWPWLKRYTEQAYGRQFDSLVVRKLVYRFDGSRILPTADVAYSRKITDDHDK